MRSVGLLLVGLLVAAGCSRAAAPATFGSTTPSSTTTAPVALPATSLPTATAPVGVPGTSLPTTTAPAVAEILDGGAVAATRDIPFTSVLALDVFAPNEPGTWPVVVLLHGGGWVGGHPDDIAPLAEALAAGGTVVFNAPYRLALEGGGYPSAFEDAACAVRFARRHAADFGGRSTKLAIVGYSAGAHIGAITALAGDDFVGDCLVEEGSSLPEVFVGIAGPYNTDLFDPLLSVFFGTDRDVDPVPWRDGNPFTHIGENPELTVRLVQGEEDLLVPAGFAVEFATALEEAGYAAELTLIPSGNHSTVVDPAGDGAITVDTVLDALG